MKLLGIGHSHISCVRHAATLVQDGLARKGILLETILMNEPRFKPWQQPAGSDGIDGFQLCPALRDEILEKSEGCDLVFSCIGGNAHNVFGLVDHPRPFDFVLEEQPELPLAPGREALPTQILAAALRKQVGFVLSLWFIRVIHRMIDAQLVHCESPPPIPSDQHVRKYPGIFREQIAIHGVAPASLRYKLWKVYSKLLRAECNELGVNYLNAPLEMQDTSGFLVENAWSADPTHANHWYGRRVIEQLVRLREPSYSLTEDA